jgi:microcystin-dependent protein
MSDQYLGEIRLFAGNYAPQGWAMCNGQSLPISQNEALYSLLGTIYGGDAQNFNLPDLRGRMPIHMGTSSFNTKFTAGQKGGAETVTLQIAELPAHNHNIKASQLPGTSSNPANNYFAESNMKQYTQLDPNNTMDTRTVSSVGGNELHNNMMPYYTLTYIIALQGNYPNRS